ncbi:MAG: hypothetical protein QNL12_08175 [Acidimicrobiia bacterium]|nr:hypothetical protein [Acidimicrobiia bacterium]MDX2467276.1 hypothetical protein [Acidimicrobiia bacterium]
MSALVAQQHPLVDDLERAEARVYTSSRAPSGTQRIHVIAWAELIRGKFDDRLRLIVIAERAEEAELRLAARLGAAALIAADRLREDLWPVIQCVAAGYYPVPYRITPRLVSRLDIPPASIGLDELAVLEQLLQGATVADVAAGMGCSERHARRKLRTIWNQVGVSGRQEGLATAARWGLPS